MAIRSAASLRKRIQSVAAKNQPAPPFDIYFGQFVEVPLDSPLYGTNVVIYGPGMTDQYTYYLAEGEPAQDVHIGGSERSVQMFTRFKTDYQPRVR